MDGSLAPTARAVFDPSKLRASGLRPRLTEWAMDRLPLVYTVLRTLLPSLRIGRFVYVTRRDDVQAVLADTAAFGVRSAGRIAALQRRAGLPCPPPLFALGTDDPAAYGKAMRALAAAAPLDDLPRLAQHVGDFVANDIAGSDRTDLGRLALLAPADLARAYFGLLLEDDERLELALCCMALIQYGFAPGAIDSPAGEVGAGAASRVSAIVRRSLDAPGGGAAQPTVIGRLLAGGMAKPAAEAAITGLLMAFVGATAIATVNIARVLLARPAAMRMARDAAMAEDDVALGRCLLEALRFKPLSPGPFRTCTAERVVAGSGPWAVRARPEDLVLAVTHSAMFDGRTVAAPNTFDPNRSPAETMVFSFGMHLCVGFAIGRAQVVQTLKPLLLRGLWQSGADRSAISYFGPFQEHFPVRLG